MLNLTLELVSSQKNNKCADGNIFIVLTLRIFLSVHIYLNKKGIDRRRTKSNRQSSVRPWNRSEVRVRSAAQHDSFEFRRLFVQMNQAYTVAFFVNTPSLREKFEMITRDGLV